MRLSIERIKRLKRLAVEEFGQHARLHLFGSRLGNAVNGSDVDPLLELPKPVARMAAHPSRMLGEHKADSILAAANLKRLFIHDATFQQRGCCDTPRVGTCLGAWRCSGEHPGRPLRWSMPGTT